MSFAIVSGECGRRRPVLAETAFAMCFGDSVRPVSASLILRRCSGVNVVRPFLAALIFAPTSGGRFWPRSFVALFSIVSGDCLLPRWAAPIRARTSGVSHDMSRTFRDSVTPRIFAARSDRKSAWLSQNAGSRE